MKCVGLDLSTHSGWACLNNGVLEEFGTIDIDTQMDLPQRLQYFHLNLTRVLERISPQWVFIEDIILGISGPKILAYLSRINGVAIHTAFGVVQERVKLYSPDCWKKNSFEGLSGHAKKWEVQIAAIKHFNISITGNFNDIFSAVAKQETLFEVKRSEIFQSRVDINNFKTILARKRDPLPLENQTKMREELKDYEKKLMLQKQNLKKEEIDFDKKMSRVSVDIAAQTGITTDIADACGITLCGMKELEKK